ncbi:MAG: AAA family ATPase, partial [Desulfofustis sp.]
RLAVQIQVSKPLITYIQDLVEFTRHSGAFTLGLSPRAGLLMLRAAKAWALLNNRVFVLPEDVQMVLPYIARHRLRTADTHEEISTEELSKIFQSVAVPV